MRNDYEHVFHIHRTAICSPHLRPTGSCVGVIQTQIHSLNKCPLNFCVPFFCGSASFRQTSFTKGLTSISWHIFSNFCTILTVKLHCPILALDTLAFDHALIGSGMLNQFNHHKVVGSIIGSAYWRKGSLLWEKAIHHLVWSYGMGNLAFREVY